MKKNRMYAFRPGGRVLKFLRIMRLGIYLLLLTTFTVSANGFSQKARVTLKIEQRSMVDIIKQLRKVSDYQFLYRVDELKKWGKRDLNVRDAALEEVMERLLEGTPLTWRLEDGVVLIKSSSPVNLPSPQAITIKGEVKDREGNRLPGVTVLIKGTDLGSVTDVNGRFVFEVPEQNEITLVFSFIGMKKQEVKYRGQDSIRVVMETDVTEMEEVVVNGIFTRKAESYTGSAVTVTKKDLLRVGNQNLFQSLKNLDPSLFLMENMEMGSDPNTMPEMKLRGTSTFPGEENENLKGNYLNKPNQPLFILDGFEASVEKVFDMDINRIESITILKDASAKAIYGSKAANGVVVVETRRLMGEGALVSYTGSVDLTVPDLSSYNLCNALEKLELELIEGCWPLDSPSAQEKYNQKRKTVLEGLDTYWLSKPLRTGIGQKHTLSIELGQKNLKTILDFSYNNVAGIMKGSDRRVLSGNLNVSYRFKSVLFRNIMTITSNKSEDSPYGSFKDYTLMNPYSRVWDKYGKPLPYYDAVTAEIPSPFYDASLNVKKESSYLEFTDNFYAEWTVTEGLKLTGRIGISAKHNDADEYYPAAHSRFFSYRDANRDRKGSYQVNNGKSHNLSGDFYLNYTKTWGKHILFANAGLNVAGRQYREMYYVGEGFPADKMDDIMFAKQFALNSKPSGNAGKSREIGYLGVISYNYDDRYMMDITWRTNASSMFGNENRWADFWSVGIGWNVHNEAFLKDIRWLEQLKVRASVGSTGNQNFQNNRSIAVYTYDMNDLYLGHIGSFLDNMENPWLKWEQKFDYNIGMDARIGSVNLRLDYYIADTKNLVTDVSLVPSTGFNSVSDNLGKVRNRGIELSLGCTFWSGKDGFVSGNFSIASNKNKIVRISEAMRVFNKRQDEEAARMNTTSPVKKYQDNMDMNTIWAVRSQGIDPANGREVFLDRNGNTTYNWNAADMVAAGSSEPKYQGNFGVNGEYKGFGVSLVFRYLGGGKMYNQTLVDKVENADVYFNMDVRALNERWREPGQKAFFKRIGKYYIYNEATGDREQEQTRATTRFVQKRNELDLSSVNVYYDFRRDWIRHIGLKRLKLAFYMNDVVKFSSIKIERGTSYPFARTMSFSLSGTF